MTLDDDLSNYLDSHASRLDLPSTDVAVIAQRGRRRRQRRNAAMGGVAALALVGGAVFAVSQPDGGEQVTNNANQGTVVDPTLQWETVDVAQGLGWSGASVAAGGDVYSLSTAAPPSDGGEDRTPVIYRSADGVEWSAIAGPADVRVTGLAGEGDSLYAVGTSAAGGAVTFARSGDGEAWDTQTLPFDLAALNEGFPGQVYVDRTDVAASAAGNIVAVSVAGDIDVTRFIDGNSAMYYPDGPGLVELPDCPELYGERGAAPMPTTPTSQEELDRLAEFAAASGEATDCPEPEVTPWSELGVSEDQVALIRGRTYVFLAGEDGTFTPVHEAPGRSTVVAADDGWWVFDQWGEAAEPAWYSADGTTWTAVPMPEGVAIHEIGVVDGRVMAVGPQRAADGTAVVALESGRVASHTNLNQLLDLPPGAGYLGARVGPLGVAVVVATEPQGQGRVVAHSFDGTSFSVNPLPAGPEGLTESVNSVEVNADAVVVRLNQFESDDLSGGEPLRQRAFVGTPD